MHGKKKVAILSGALILVILPVVVFALLQRQDVRQRASETAVQLPPAGYSLVWEDQFSQTSLDASRWNYFTGQGSFPDIMYSPDSVSLAEGILNIKTYTENGKHYTGWITTENKYQPLYGYMEARIDFSAAPAGAFWLFHNLVNVYGDPWNHGVELDIVEHGKIDYLGNDVSDTASSNLNWGEYAAEWDNHPSVGSGLRGAGLGAGFHTYSMEWTPVSQKYYIDGQFLWEVNDSTLTPISKRDEYLLLTYHPEGGITDFGSKTDSTVKMKVDYVKVYQLNPTPPTAPTNLSRSGGSGNANFSWDIVANATSYNVKRSSIAGGPYTTLGTTTELSYTDSTADPTQQYYYVVSAVNSTGESSASSEIRVSPNLARGKITTASSTKQAPSNAVDANNSSFWESEWAKDPQWIYVDLQAASQISGVILNWEHAYAKSYTIEVSTDSTNWTSVYSTTSGDGGVDEISFSSVSARYVRMTGTQRVHTYADPSPFGYAIKEFEVFGSAATPKPTGLKGFTNKQSVKLAWNPVPGASSYSVKRSTQNGGPYTTVATGVGGSSYIDSGLTSGTTYFHVVTAASQAGESPFSNEVRTTPHDNLALWQKTRASSKENGDTRPYKAVDGKIDTFAGISTRWASVAADPQWLSIDLQTVYPINRVLLNWDQYARDYEIQTSLDGNSWTSAYSTTNGDGGVDDLTIASVDARFVRMYGKQRGTSQTNYSLKEFEVFAANIIAPTITPTPTSTPTPPRNTSLNINLFLHGLGKGGDSANPNGGGNPNPVRTTRNIKVEIFKSVVDPAGQNQLVLVLTKDGAVVFDTASGSFKGNIDIGTTLTTGLYSVKIKADQFLRGLIPGIQTITQGSVNTLPQATLVSGDINNDNTINILDYAVLLDCYSDIATAKNCADPLKKLSADLTDDGTVNQFDYNLFLRELTNVQGE